MGVDAETAAKGIETFKGTHRRFEKKGFLNGAVVIDDYAHHPTEIKSDTSRGTKNSRTIKFGACSSHTLSHEQEHCGTNLSVHLMMRTN